MSDDEGKKLEAQMNSAKSEAEKMELAMKYSQIIQQRMTAGGGVDGISPKVITNSVSSANNMLIASGGQFYNNLKYDDILVWMYNKVSDLSGNTVITFKEGTGCDPENMFISSDNSGYACYSYGTLNFSDGRTLSELFNPHLVREGGKVYLAYMYYSPKKTSILQCRIPF